VRGRPTGRHNDAASSFTAPIRATRSAAVGGAGKQGEREATMALFWGALGVFKNPWSHPQVEYDDPTLAAEVVLLADLLLRMLDRTGKRLKTTKSFAEHDARSGRRSAAAKKATSTRAARK